MFKLDIKLSSIAFVIKLEIELAFELLFVDIFELKRLSGTGEAVGNTSEETATKLSTTVGSASGGAVNPSVEGLKLFV